VGRNLNDISA